MKTYQITVLVQLPNGSFQRCPLARYGEDNVPHVVEQENEKEANDWIEFILPSRANIKEVILP